MSSDGANRSAYANDAGAGDGWVEQLGILLVKGVQFQQALAALGKLALATPRCRTDVFSQPFLLSSSVEIATVWRVLSAFVKHRALLRAL